MVILFAQGSFCSLHGRLFVSARDFLSSSKIVFESAIASYAGFEKKNLALLGFCNKFCLIFFFFFFFRETFFWIWRIWCDGPCGELDHLEKDCLSSAQLPIAVGDGRSHFTVLHIIPSLRWYFWREFSLKGCGNFEGLCDFFFFF